MRKNPKSLPKMIAHQARWFPPTAILAWLFSATPATADSPSCTSSNHGDSTIRCCANNGDANLAAKWGIEVTALRLSANGNIVDFRYRVIDPKKASLLVDPKITPLLIDQENGAQLHVPSMPKAGQLRGITEHPTAGKIYIMLFANTRKAVKPGHKVTLVVGDTRAENLLIDE